MGLSEELWLVVGYLRLALSIVFSIGSALSALSIAFGVACAAQLVGRAANGPPDGLGDRFIQFAGGLTRVLAMSARHWSLFGAFPRRRIIAARLFTELQIINPPAAPPPKGDYTPQKYAEKLAQWKDGERERKARVKQTLRKYLQEEPSLLTNCWQSIKAAIFRQKGKKKSANPAEISDFASLDESRRAIMRYFAALPNPERFPGTWLYGSDEEERKDVHKRFLVEARVRVGYLAPTFLINGLLNRASDDDGWKRILDNYRPLMNRRDLHNAEFQDLRELRTFMFNCWLLWGPSVFICACDQWRTSSNALLLQYGYGDENNSIDVLVKGGMAAEFRQRLADGLAMGTGVPGLVGAIPSEVVGRFRWGPDLSEHELGLAQGFVRGGNFPELRQPIDGRVVLECDPHKVQIGEGQSDSQYYSAYLWIAFMLHDGKHLYFDETWRNVIVFFEHGNIAEPLSYLALKRQLVSKARSTIERILAKDDVDGRTVHLSYACAFDDANCSAGHGRPLLPAPHAAAGGRATPHPPDLTIRKLLEESVRLHWPTQISRDRLNVYGVSGNENAPPNPYSSCHLPAAVEEFYGALDAVAEGDGGLRTSVKGH